MLPDPALVLTLPSLHDATVLDCRVYHPPSIASSSSLTTTPSSPPWRRHAAVLAHPYAPLGGCFDDPVVAVVAATLLRLGFLVATFNFRGASDSAGRTSWTARAERDDYASVVGFVSYYAHLLDPSSSSSPVLLMGGYSYGAMITAQLPSLPTIRALFATPLAGSPAAEIRHRAEHLAAAENAVLAEAAAPKQSPRSPRRSLGLRVGGDEDMRQSRESPRPSFCPEAAEERLRRGVADMVSRARRSARQHDQSTASATPSDRLLPPQDPPRHRPAYLLISPLQGVITNLATMSFPNPFHRATTSFSNPFHRSRSKTASPPATPAGLRRTASTEKSRDESTDSGPATGSSEPVAALEDTDDEHKLVCNPTLAVYGDRDVFVAARKLREWAGRLESEGPSLFRAHEVSTAGHFWVEGNTLYVMRDAVETFGGGLVGSQI